MTFPSLSRCWTERNDMLFIESPELRLATGIVSNWVLFINLRRKVLTGLVFVQGRVGVSLLGERCLVGVTVGAVVGSNGSAAVTGGTRGRHDDVWVDSKTLLYV